MTEQLVYQDRDGLPPVYCHPSVNGNIDWASRSFVSGWIKNIHSENPILIDVYFDGIVVLHSICADSRRDDLKAAGFGSGYYGFSAGLDAPNSIVSEVAVTLANREEVLLLRSFPRPSTSQLPFDKAGSLNRPSVDRKSYKVQIEFASTSRIVGWAVNMFELGEIFDLTLMLDGITLETFANNGRRDDLRETNISEGFGGFDVELQLSDYPKGEYELTLSAPDGTSQSTILIVDEIRPALTVRDGFTIGYMKNISVIVPIYNAADDVAVCIARLGMFTPDDIEIILIDDCSTSIELLDILSAVNDQRFQVVRNKKNIGYTKTANRGILYSGTNDVILLNSDARVTPRWVEGLRNAAYSRTRIGTVTAMSDRAGPFSAPKLYGNALPSYVDEATYARAFRRRSLGLYPVVPTGNGFCLYLKRDCIDEVGLLDEVAFPRGYGEENDFCMRALRLGWSNIVDDRTYVFHERSRSFGSEKGDLIAAGRDVIDQRYPEYKFLVRAAFGTSSFSTARHRGSVALADCINEQMLPRVLYVISTKTGGTPQTNQDLIMALSDRFDCWILHSDTINVELSRYKNHQFSQVSSWKLSVRVDPITHRSMEYDAIVNDIFLSYDFDILHIRHIAWHSLGLMSVARKMNVKIVYSFHDYYCLSPTVKLIDDRGIFRGGQFDLTPSVYRQSLWGHNTQPLPNGAWLDLWKSNMQSEIALSHAFVTTSESAKDIICNELPQIESARFYVIPHGRDFSRMEMIGRMPEAAGPIKIIIPGNIDAAKGLEIIYQLAEFDNFGLIEFHIIGEVNMTAKGDHPRIVRHGKYNRSEFIDIVAEISPHVGGIFSIWNETYCHTLTELWSAGIPAIAFDFPTVADRIRRVGGGWIMPHLDVQSLFDNIVRVVTDEKVYNQACSCIGWWQCTEGSYNNTRYMAEQYEAIYTSI